MPYVGSSVPRVEDLRLLHGRGRFVVDLTPLPNLHHVAFVRSPHALARVRGVDAAAALAMDGVVAVVTPEDARRHLRPFSVGVGSADRYWPIALERTRYVGEPVAMVVATDRYLAEDAAEQVAVDYEPEEPVMDLEAAPVVSRRSFRHAEPERAFAVAAHRVSGSFRFPRYSSTPIECYAVIADLDAPGDQACLRSPATCCCSAAAPATSASAVQHMQLSESRRSRANADLSRSGDSVDAGPMSTRSLRSGLSETPDPRWPTPHACQAA